MENEKKKEFYLKQRCLKNGRVAKRFEVCMRCKYSSYYDSCYCGKMKREVTPVTAMHCPFFQYSCPEYDYENVDKNGIPYRSKQGRELLTAQEWAKHGFKPIVGRTGEIMHPCVGKRNTEIYYEFKDVEYDDEGRRPNDSDFQN